MKPLDPHDPHDAQLIVFHALDYVHRQILARFGRWVLHIEARHPEVDQHFDAVERVFADPYQVTQDATYRNRLNYYRPNALPAPYDRLYLKVCVAFSGHGLTGMIGEVVTAYPTTRIGRGEVQQWP